MDDTTKEEYKTLQDLEGQGSLDDIQKTRLETLKLVEHVEKTTAEREAKQKKDFESALAQKEHFRAKLEKEEADRKALEQRLNQPNPPAQGAGLNVDDYLDISTSLEGLDQREKEYVAQQHKLTGKSLKEIRESEDYSLWNSGYKFKVEKEKALAPSSTQPDVDKPRSFEDRLANAVDLQEKEKLLTEAGLYKSPSRRPDRVNIGNQR